MLLGGLGNMGQSIMEAFGFSGDWQRVTWISNVINGNNIFNQLVKYAKDLLTTNPANWKTDAWNFVSGLNAAMVAVGSGLVVFFFLYGFFTSSIDAKNELKIQNMIKMLIKLVLVNGVVVFNMYIITAIMKSIMAIIEFIPTQLTGTTSDALISNSTVIYDDLFVRAIESDSNFFDTILGSIITFLYLIVMAAAGVIILYYAFTRFLKLYSIIPFGAIALATLASDNKDISITGVSYFKYVIATCLEGGVMLIAICLFPYIMAAGDSDPFLSVVEGTTATTPLILVFTLKYIILAVLCIGAVKGAMTLINKAFGI